MEIGTLKERIRRLSAASRASRQQADDDRDARNAALADGDEAGLGLREMAQLAEMSVSHVQRIVADVTAERQS